MAMTISGRMTSRTEQGMRIRQDGSVEEVGQAYYNKAEKIGIYIHIPMCLRKCFYCDFYSVTDLAKDDVRRKLLIDAMVRDIRISAALAQSAISGTSATVVSSAASVTSVTSCGMQKPEADTIFFGGGTPSLLSGDEVAKLLDACASHFQVADGAEISLECNPATVTEDLSRLADYRKAGVNRLSIGAQAFDDSVLNMLGRLHSAEQVGQTVEAARRAGFENLSLDLMFGIPEQSMASWERTVERAMELEPEHLSFYSLEFAEGTPFVRRWLAGELVETGAEADRKMYERCRAALGRGGYEQYEISNAAKRGFQCRHNLKYWNLAQYVGIGPAAHSFVKGTRYGNFSDVDKYVNSVGEADAAREFCAKNSFEDSASEFMFTGLRRTCGVRFADFEQVFGVGLWEVFASERREFTDFIKRGMTWEDADGLGLTHEGMSISNRIMSLFV